MDSGGDSQTRLMDGIVYPCQEPARVLANDRLLSTLKMAYTYVYATKKQIKPAAYRQNLYE